MTTGWLNVAIQRNPRTGRRILPVDMLLGTVSMYAIGNMYSADIQVPVRSAINKGQKENMRRLQPRVIL